MTTTQSKPTDIFVAEVKHAAETVASKIQRGQESVSESDLKQLDRIFDMPGYNNDAVIPYLDRDLLKSGTLPPEAGRVTLVRYRGMVQDMLEPEFYLSQVNGVQTKYRDYYSDNQEHPMQVDHNFLEERQLLFIVPIPYATAETTKTSEAATLAESDMDTTAVNNKKRSKDDMVMAAESPVRKQPVLIPNDETPEKKNSSTPTSVASLSQDVVSAPTMDDSDWWPAGNMGSDPNQCPVLAKMYYDDEDKNRLKLNQVVDVIAVLSLNPLDATSFDHSSSRDAMLDGVVLPPPSRLARLHVLSFREVNLAASQLSPAQDMPMEEDSVDARSLTIDTLSENVFSGNKTASEALLMALMSMAERQLDNGVYCPIQKTQDSTLGCASLHFKLPNQQACQTTLTRLQAMLKQVVPVVAVLHVNHETLVNGTLKAPAKNEFGRLVPSPLQLPKGSVVLIHHDVTATTPPAQAQESLSALTSMVKSHVVPYTFDGGVSYNFEADYCVIVLSSGSGPSFDCALSMTLPLVETTKEAPSVLSPESLQSIQSYLSKCRGTPSPHGANNIGLSKQVLEVAQDDFIKKRTQQRSSNVQELAGEEDFHRWLTLTRLQARSRVGLNNQGESQFSCTADDWKASLSLDDAMRSSS